MRQSHWTIIATVNRSFDPRKAKAGHPSTVPDQWIVASYRMTSKTAVWIAIAFMRTNGVEAVYGFRGSPRRVSAPASFRVDKTGIRWY